MQDWALSEVQFGVGGKYDQAALSRILITDDLHRLRSQLADDITADSVVQFPLPPAAAEGGLLEADLQTSEQRKLTAGM